MHELNWRQQEPTTIVLKEGHLTDKSDHRVGHLNTILARGGGNFQKFKCLEFSRGGRVSKFRDGRPLLSSVFRRAWNLFLKQLVILFFVLISGI